MGQKPRVQLASRLVHKPALIDAAVIRLVVFEAEVGNVIAQGVKEVIITIMLSSEQSGGLRDQIAEAVPNVRGRSEGLGTVCGCVQFCRRSLPRIEGNDFQILRGQHG